MTRAEFLESLRRALNGNMSAAAVEDNIQFYNGYFSSQTAQGRSEQDVLRELLRRQIPVVIDSDAHAPSHLSRDWETALRLLRDLAPRGLCECRCAAPVSGTELHAFLSR